MANEARYSQFNEKTLPYLITPSNMTIEQIMKQVANITQLKLDCYDNQKEHSYGFR
jgi:hypothetical protein